MLNPVDELRPVQYAYTEILKIDPGGRRKQIQPRAAHGVGLSVLPDRRYTTRRLNSG